MRDVLVTACVLGLLPLILARPYIGVIAWCWISYMNPHRLCWGFAYHQPFAQIVAVATVVSFVLHFNPKDYVPRRVPASMKVLLAFVCWTSVTTYFALVPEDALDAWTRVLKIQFLTLLSFLILRERRTIEYVVVTIALSIGFYGVKGGAFTVLTGGEYMVFGPRDSFFGDNTSFALAMLMALPLLEYVRTMSVNPWWRRAGVLAGVLSLAAVVGTYSRGAWVTILAMAGFLCLTSRRRVRIAAVLLVGLVFLWAAMPEEWAGRMRSIESYETDGSAMGRINAWWFAFNLACDRPLAGGGFEAFDPDLFHKYAPEPEDFHDSHSIYFEVLGEHGFVGLALFLWLAALGWRSAQLTIRDTRYRPELFWANKLARMTRLSLVAFGIGGAFLGLAYFDLFYHCVVIIELTRTEVLKKLGQSSPVDAEGLGERSGSAREAHRIRGSETLPELPAQSES